MAGLPMFDANELFFFFTGTFVSIFSIVDPLLAAPVFISLTAHDTPKERKVLAKKASLNTFGILVTFLVAGTLILGFFGISIPALRIAGGLMILASAYGMMNKKEKRLLPEEEREAEEREDISFSPLAMPLLAGPGAIAVIIGLTANAKDIYHILAIVLVIGIVSFLCYLTMVLSDKIVAKLGETLMKAFSRIMGFILLCANTWLIQVA